MIKINTIAAVPFNESDDYDDDAPELTDFPEDLQGVLSFNKALDKHFQYLDGLSRSDLLVLLKHEIYNRIFLQGTDLGYKK